MNLAARRHSLEPVDVTSVGGMDPTPPSRTQGRICRPGQAAATLRLRRSSSGVASRASPDPALFGKGRRRCGSAETDLDSQVGILLDVLEDGVVKGVQVVGFGSVWLGGRNIFGR